MVYIWLIYLVITDLLLRVQNIEKSYLTGKNEHLPVLKGVNFKVEEGQIAAVIGASGAGKSTLLHIIGALDRPSTGNVFIDGENIFQFKNASLAQFRNKNVGFVFQFHHLLPEFTAVENVAIPAMIGGKNINDAMNCANELLRLVNLDNRASHKPSELSGGEQQRVAVARALVNSPKLILADEPSGNLDEENGEMLHELLWNLSRTQKQTFVIVTHNADLAKRADKVFRLHEGIIDKA